MMITNQTLSITAQYVYQYFNQNVVDISRFNVDNIFFTDNLTEDVHLFGQTTFDYSNAEAVTIHPNTIIQEIIILVGVQIDNFDVFNFTRILIHEFIHVYDYIRLSIEFFDGDISNLERYPYFNTLQDFSEFRAYSYADIIAIKCVDSMLGTNRFHEILNIFKDNFVDYFTRICSDTFKTGILPNIWNVFGNINILDVCNNIQNLEQSSIYEYLPILIHSKKQRELLYQIFCLCHEIEQSGNCIDLIPNLASLVSRLGQKIQQ